MAERKESGKKFRVRPERELAFIVIFESLFRDIDDADELFDSIIAGADADGIYENAVSGAAKADMTFVRAALNGVRENSAKIKDTICAHIRGWKYERISKVSLAALQLALWEICFAKSAHHGTVINECVELAKIYDDEKASVFVNGVLGNVVKELDSQ